MPSHLPLNGIVSTEIDGCRFGFYTASQIRKISVKCLTSPIALDELGTPVRGGLYDPCLGPLDELESCETCGLKSKYCPGHMGHVELAYPVYHPLLFNLMFKLARCMCFNCHRFLMSEVVVKRYRDAFVLLRQGRLLEALNKMTEEGKVAKDTGVEEEVEMEKPAPDAPPHSHISYQQHCLFLEFFRRMNVKKCSHCHAHNPALIKDSSTRLFQQGLSGKLLIANQAHGANVGPLEGSALRDEEDEDSDIAKGEPRRYLPPLEMQQRLAMLFLEEKDIIKELFSAVNPDSEELSKADSSIFFLTVLPVAPSKFRPTSKGMGDRESEHPQNVYYSRILNSNARLVGSLGEEEALTGPQLVRTILEMQRAVNFLIDSNKAPANAPNGIKQLLEKKQGLFRKHMMGKRVNFAARSVISPDVFLATNEIGVPDVFAKKLTFPEPVTTYNYKELSAMVSNGPDVYPGANYIEYADGKVVAIQGGDKHADRRLAQSKTLLTENRSEGSLGGQTRVYRHVKNGDLVLMNRQPTLHKPSMMASKVHVQFGERVLRMHYANCKTFNADFDGDEMNMHYPQTYQAKAEAKNIMLCDRQYVVPTNGGPLRGLIQDHVVSGVLLTRRGTFFEKEQFQQLIYAACCNVDSDMPIETPIPCILAPKKLWSGKQMVTVILKYLANVYGDGLTLNMEGKNTVREKLWTKESGEGSETGEGVVIIRNSELLTGVLDKSQIGSASYGLVHSCYEIFGPTMAGELLSTLGRLLTTHLQSHGFTCGIDDLLLTSDCDQHRTDQLNQTKQKGKDVASKFVSLEKKDLRADAVAGNNDHLRLALRGRLQSDDDHASLDTVMQQALNAFTTEIIGSCLPQGFQKRFPNNFLSLMTMSGAKGSEVNQSHISCLLGQQVLEGRRVPVMPSGKALPCFEACDPNPRAGGYVGDRYLTGIRPQEFFFHCMAGREGLVDTTVKTSKSGYLQRCLIKHLEGLVVQYDYTVRDSDGSIVQFRYGEDGIDTCETKFLSKFPFLARNSESLLKTYNIEEMVSRNAFNPTGRVDDLMANLAKNPEDGATKLALQELNPATNLGVVSDAFFQSLTEYFKEDPEGWFEHKSEVESQFGKRILSKDTFKTLMFLKFHQSLVQPGDAVGVIAGQSLGEPSTQMTLNTFHLAGHGETNVTLGIPRLTEVVMTASDNIKTPSMTLPLRPHLGLDDAYDLAAELYKLCLPELLTGVEVQETLVESTSGQRYRNYEIVVDFHSSRVLAKEHRITSKQLQAVLGKQFVPTLLLAISKETKTRLRASVGEGMSSTAFDGIDEDAAPAMPDYEETQQRKKELASYDDEAETAASKNVAEDDDEEPENMDEIEGDEEESHTAFGSTINAELVQGLRSRFQMLQHLEFSKGKSSMRMGVRLPAYSKKLLMVNLVETVAENFVVQQVPKINKCFVGKKKNSELCTVSTDGVNLVAAQRYAGMVDVDKIYCNDIHAVLATFGVEAARSCIIQEISKVFGVYDIKVDKRHLFLVADYMTFDGGYRAMNRVGMDAKASPWLQMSFETSVKFLCQAAQRGLTDSSKSPSARIVLGQPVKGGTGFFDVLQPLL